MKIDAPRIKSWVERIEALMAERAALNGDIRDIFLEIKKGDHDAKAIRKLIQRRAQDEGQLAEQDALLAAYTDAVAGKIKALEAVRAGATTKEAAKIAGISTGAVSAVVHVQKSRKLNGGEVQKETLAEPAGDAEAPAETSADGLGVTTIMEGSAPVAAGEKPVPSANACGGGEHHASEPISGTPKAADRRDAGVAPGPQDPIWDELARVKRDLDDAVRLRVPA